MKTATLWMLLVLGGLVAVGCSEADANLETCEGGACETQEDCEMECEDVCGDPDFESFNCVDMTCRCVCFFGCE